MRAVLANGVWLHVAESGPADAPAVLFANSLGTDLRLWDALLPLLPEGLRYVRYDKRGHGLSDAPPGPWSIADLADDAAALIEVMGLGPVVFVGLSIGGMIGQHLAAARPDLVRALVLSNTAVRTGTPEMWSARIEVLRSSGLASLENAILDRWFGPSFRQTPEARLWGAMLTRTSRHGYVSCCEAIASADLQDRTAGLRLPALAIAGEFDGALSPDLVAATARLLPRAQCHVIPGAGHLPCVETPHAFASLLSPFLRSNTHA